MQMDNNRITAGILAGGKSSRMGTDKACLSYEGRTFLENLLKQCDGFAARMVSVDRAAKYAWIQASMGNHILLVEDEIAGYGPVEGIYQLLTHMETSSCLVMATDMPNLTHTFLTALAAQYREEDALVLTVEGKYQPLCAIYHKNCLPVLRKFRSEGIHKPRLLYEKVRTLYLPIEELGYDPGVIRNVNTPEEYRRL